MATSGPITYLVMEDQFPFVAVPRERLPHSTGMSSPLIGMSEHPGGGCADGGEGTTCTSGPYFRPGQLAYRRQFRTPVSAAAWGRGPDASLPRPGAVPHPPLVGAPCPSRCPRPGPGGIRSTARHLTIARLPAPGPPGRGHDAGAGVTCAFTALARI